MNANPIGRSRLIQAADETTLRALAAGSDQQDARDARAELLLRRLWPAGTRVRSRLGPAQWTGVVSAEPGTNAFPVRVNWSNGVVENCTTLELELAPGEVVETASVLDLNTARKWYVYEDENEYKVAQVYGGQPHGAEHFPSREQAEALAARCNEAALDRRDDLVRDAEDDERAQLAGGEG